MKHPGHTYRGFVPAISERGMTPRWLSSAGEERRWWSRGAAEGAGKEVEVAPGVCAEIRAVSGSLEGDRAGISWRLNDGGTMVLW
jgi:hypothetical protein